MIRRLLLVFLGDFSLTGTFVPATDADISFTCGCDTPTPAPVVAESRSSSSSSSSSPVPLEAVIGGSVAGAVLLAIAGVLVFKFHRKKRDGSPVSSPPDSLNYPVVSHDSSVNYPVVPNDRFVPALGGSSVGKPPPPAYEGFSR